MSDPEVLTDTSASSSNAAAAGGSNRDQTTAFRWSKDYVEHLRTVHFTLVAICIGLLTLASSESQNQVSEAREQLQMITESLHSWDVSSLTNAAAKRISEFNTAEHESLPAQMFGATAQNVDTLFVARHGDSPSTLFSVEFRGNWMVDGPIRQSGTLGGKEHPVTSLLIEGPQLPIAKPATLAGFQKLWDSLVPENRIIVPTKLAQFMYVFTPPAKGYIDLKTIDSLFERIDVRFSKSRPGTPNAKCTLMLARATTLEDLQPIAKALAKPTPYMYVCRELNPISSDTISFIPVNEFREIDFDGQNVLLEKVRAQQLTRGKGLLIPHGTFAHSFSALDQVTRSYQNLSLDSFDPILESEQRRSGESFEALGVKFPADETTRWGIVVVIAVQLYIWIILRQRSATLAPGDAAFEVAWLGLFPSLIARVICLISIALLPVLVVADLATRAFEMEHVSSLYRGSLVASALLSAIMATMCWKNLPDRQNA
jgi:hypothetical protein